jgi:hypothetical protein
MTSQQREQAVTALAALITTWQHHPDPDTERLSADYPMPLPLPGAVSNTDHAA